MRLRAYLIAAARAARWTRRVATLTAIAATAALGAAQTAPAYVNAVLEAIQDHPAIAAAAASVAAAENNLAGVRQPLELSVEGSYTRYTVEGDNADQFPQPDPELTARLVAHPFLYGDLADQEAQRRVELERARLALREATASVEVQALTAAMNLAVAQRAHDVANEAVELARTALEVTEARMDRGAARAADVARAQQDLARARAELARAERNLELARATLASWTGAAAIPTIGDRIPAFAPVDGAPPSVLRARLDVELAEVGVGAAERNLLPVAQARYSWLLDEDQGTITVALESRTLSPSLAYQTTSPVPSSGSGAAAALAGVPPFAPLQAPPEPPRATGGFSVGVSLTLSPQRFEAVEAARARVDAARANLEAAELRAELERSSLDAARIGARTDVELAETDLALALADLDDVERRVELGLATELERRQQQLAVARSRLAVLRAEVDLASSQLERYAYAAIPVSEVWK